MDTRTCQQIIGGYLLELASLRVGRTTWHTLLGPREQPAVTWSWSMRQVEHEAGGGVPMSADGYPGTAHHQRVLRAVVSYYAPDPRVQAVLVFGSLGRGTWDRYSDLDLDIILGDGVSVAPVQELARLCASFAPIGEQAALIVAKRTDEGDVVLASLLQLSVRYHALASTSPNIVDSLRLLWGRIGEEDIRAAGRAAIAACARCSRWTSRCSAGDCGSQSSSSAWRATASSSCSPLRGAPCAPSIPSRARRTPRCRSGSALRCRRARSPRRARRSCSSSTCWTATSTHSRAAASC